VEYEIPQIQGLYLHRRTETVPTLTSVHISYLFQLHKIV